MIAELLSAIEKGAPVRPILNRIELPDTEKLLKKSFPAKYQARANGQTI